MVNEVEPGIYEHFKGTRYRVLGVHTHTETEERLVIYVDLDDNEKQWARPIKMFLDEVDKPELDYKGPRFRRVE